MLGGPVFFLCLGHSFISEMKESWILMMMIEAQQMK
jgi:hypothetical protein